MRALIAFDGSSDAAAAIGFAASLLKPAGALVLHVRGAPAANRESFDAVRDGLPLEEAMKARDEREAQESKALADDGVRLARDAGWKAEAESIRTFGGVWDEILRVAEACRAEVIVIGARGLTGVSAALGSVSDAVVHGARQPVLVVPSASPQMAADAPALVAYDGSDGAHAALDAAAALFLPRELLICHVGGDPLDADPVAGEALDRARAAGCAARAVPAPVDRVAAGLSGRARHAIVTAAQENAAAAVVVGSRGRSVAGELMLGSVAMGVLHHAARPVLVVPPVPADD